MSEDQDPFLHEADQPVEHGNHVTLDPWKALSPVVKLAKDIICTAYKVTKRDKFPAPNPISMDREHLEVIRSQAYVVAAKMDGTRFHIVCTMLGPGRPAILLVDRRWDVYQASYVSGPRDLFQRRTVLDAELVGSVLFVFDALVVRGVDVTALDYTERMDAASSCARSLEVGFGVSLVRVEVKPLYATSASATLARLEHLQPGPCDGLVFTPVDEPVRVFTHWTMFKFKHSHTIDLRLVMSPVDGHRLPPRALVNRMSAAMAGNTLPAKQPRSLLDVLQRGKRAPPGGGGHASRKSAAGSASPHTPSPAPPAVATDVPKRWNAQLRYTMHGEQERDATKAFLFAGRSLVFRIRKTPAFRTLHAALGKRWAALEQATAATNQTVVVLDVIVECDVQMDEDKDIVWVAIERARPDKERPNTHVTITNTLISLQQGVRQEDLAALGPPDEAATELPPPLPVRGGVR